MSQTMSRSLVLTLAALLLVPLTAGPAHAVPPPNDTVETATAVRRLPRTFVQDTSEARVEPIDGELVLCPGGVPPALQGSVWFRYTARDAEGFAVDAGPRTGYDVAFIVTEGVPRVGTNPVACGVDDVVVPTVAGRTYYVMAFSDRHDVIGGRLQVTFMSVPPEPEVALTVDRRAQQRRDGSVRMRGTYTCTGADTVEISGTVQQGPVDAPTRSHVVDHVVRHPRCDGEPHRWRALATREGPMQPLRPGPARSHVGAIACTVIECVVTPNPVRVTIQGFARR